MSSLSMENIVRPFVKIESRPLQIVTPQPVTDLVTLPPAFIQWGSASNFITPASQLTNPYLGTDLDRSFQNTVNRIQQTESIFDYERLIEIPEQDREVTVVRVYNPEELELPVEERTSFLDVERIDRITFRMPDGARWVFVLDNEGR